MGIKIKSFKDRVYKGGLTMHLSKMWAQLTCKIPPDVDATVETRDHEIVMRLSKGNVRLQLGMFKTEEDMARERVAILEHKFI